MARVLESYDAPKGARRVREGAVGEGLPTRQYLAGGLLHAGARLPEKLSEATSELLFLSRRGEVEAWKRRSEPPGFSRGSLQNFGI